MAGCPPTITRGVIVGEPDGVERFEEVGDVESSSGGDRDVADGGSFGCVIKDGGESDGEHAEGGGADDAVCTVGGT